MLSIPLSAVGVGRSSLVLAVFFISFLNGLTEIVCRSINTYGLTSAVEATFGISFIVFLCLFLIIRNLYNQIGVDNAPATRSDWAIYGFALLLAAMPHPAFSWVAITITGWREYRQCNEESFGRRAAVLMLGITVPMFWGRLVFSLLSSFILRCDAFLVAFLTNSHRVGNVVNLPNHEGFLWIAAPCSSFANISLAMLCWLAFTAYSGRPRSAEDYMTCAFAILNVVIINVARIAILAKRPDLFDTIHGPFGSTVVSWLTATVVVATCASGVKREQKFTRSTRCSVPSGNASNCA